MAYYLGTLYLVSDRIGPGNGISDRIDGGGMTRTGMDGNKPTTVLVTTCREKQMRCQKTS